MDGKVAVVTGSARGIGKALAKALLQQKVKVAIVDILLEAGAKTEEEFQKLFGKDSVKFICTDVTDSEQLKAAFQTAVATFGGLDIVSNNAGIINERLWRKCIDINVSAVIEGTYIATDIMRKDKGGRGGVIVNTGSVLSFMPAHSVPVYTASKHAVIGFTRSWALHPDVKSNGVRVNLFGPDLIWTDIQSSAETRDPTAFDSFNYDNPDALTLEFVAEGFMKLVEGELTGAIMKITKKDGHQLMFPGEKL